MPTTRKPHLATERFLQPIFDEETGAVRTTRMIEPGDRTELTDAEVIALSGKVRTAAPVEPPAPEGPPDVRP